MAKITFLVVGKLKEKYLQQAMAEYEKRISRYTKVEIMELVEARMPSDPTEGDIERALHQEGEEILRRQPKQSILVSLAIEGEGISSEALAEKLLQWEQMSSHIVFVIGSSHGLSVEVKKASAFKLSLSTMTFPHQLARVMLGEQVYRAFSINQNAKYHK